MLFKVWWEETVTVEKIGYEWKPLNLLHHYDALVWGRRNIDVVHSSSSSADNFQIFRRFDDFVRYFGGRSDNQAMIILKNEQHTEVFDGSQYHNRFTARTRLTGISAINSSFVSFVLTSTAIPLASKISLQQLSKLSLIRTRLISREKAILIHWSAYTPDQVSILYWYTCRTWLNAAIWLAVYMQVSRAQLSRENLESKNPAQQPILVPRA